MDLFRIFGEYVVEARRLQKKHEHEITMLVGLETEYINEQSLKVAKLILFIYNMSLL